jgi:hypothetical protein
MAPARSSAAHCILPSRMDDSTVSGAEAPKRIFRLRFTCCRHFKAVS